MHRTPSIEVFKARTNYYPPSVGETIAHSSIRAVEQDCSTFFNRDVDPGIPYGGNQFLALAAEIQKFATAVFRWCPESTDRDEALWRLETARMLGNEVLAYHRNNVARGDTRSAALMVIDTLIGEYKGETLRARFAASRSIALGGDLAKAALEAALAPTPVGEES